MEHIRVRSLTGPGHCRARTTYRTQASHSITLIMHMHMRCRRPPGGKAWRVGGMRVLGYLADALTLAIVNFALSAVAYITLPTFDVLCLVIRRGRLTAAVEPHPAFFG